jgi:hypothetical protein
VRGAGTLAASLLILNYTITLFTGSLLSRGFIFSILALLLLLASPLFPVLIPIGVFFFREPLNAWDARSIWFFHSRMIYLSDGVNAQTGFNDPSIAWSHPDYPTLVPSLAAQLMKAVGYWNEYLPKLSLLLLLVPAFLWLASLLQKKKETVLLVAMVLGPLANVETGLMDGLLAIYAGFSLIWFHQWWQSRRTLDLANVYLSLGICLGLKNEGTVFVGIALFCMAAWILINHGSRLKVVTRSLWIPALGFVHLLIWHHYKSNLQIESDLHFLNSVGFQHVKERLFEGISLKHISNELLFSKRGIVGLLVFFGVAFFFQKSRQVRRLALMSISVSFLYFCVLFAVYLMTPYDLNWHLQTSATRTILPVLSTLTISLVILLNDDQSKMC